MKPPVVDKHDSDEEDGDTVSNTLSTSRPPPANARLDADVADKLPSQGMSRLP